MYMCNVFKTPYLFVSFFFSSFSPGKKKDEWNESNVRNTRRWQSVKCVIYTMCTKCFLLTMVNQQNAKLRMLTVLTEFCHRDIVDEFVVSVSNINRLSSMTFLCYRQHWLDTLSMSFWSWFYHQQFYKCGTVKIVSKYERIICQYLFS